MTHLALIHPLLFDPGDRLSRDEFLQRWEQMPALKSAELIDGVVYMPSPLSFEHGRCDLILQGWVTLYMSRCPFTEAASNSTWLMLESAPQPDVALRIRPSAGGQGGLRDKYATGAPELAIEVAKSSRSYDLGPKRALYQRAGVREYLAALVEEQRVEWRVLRDGQYELLEAGPDGILRSEVFPGLWLDEQAFWANDTARVLAVLEQGLASPEFTKFVAAPR